MCRYCKKLQELRKDEREIFDRVLRHYKLMLIKDEKFILKADEIITHLRSMLSENDISLYWKYEIRDFDDYVRDLCNVLKDLKD